MAEILKCVTYWTTSRDGGAVCCLLILFSRNKKEGETVLIFIFASWSSTGLLKCGSKLIQRTNLEL